MIKVGAISVLKDDKGPGGQMDTETFLDLACETGMDIVDISMDKGFTGTTPAGLARIKRKCVKYGLPVGLVSGSGGLVGTDEERRARTDKAKNAVAVARFLGAPKITVQGGGYRTESYWKPQVDAFKEICDYAAEQGIIIAIHGHGPPTTPTAEQMLNLYKDVDRENTTLVVDTHKWEGYKEGPLQEHYYGWFEALAPLATSVRAKIYKIDSGREEWCDYPRILSVLRKNSFNGALSIYYMGSGRNQANEREGMAKGVKYLKTLVS